MRAAIISAATLLPARAPLEVKETHLIQKTVLDPKKNRDANQASFDQVAWVKSDGYDEEFIFVGGVLPCLFVKKKYKPVTPKSRAELCIARFSLEDGEDTKFFPVGSDRVMDLIGMPKNDGLLFATQRSIGAIDFEGDALTFGGNRKLQTENPAADFRGGNLDFLISKDAKTVQFMDYRSRSGKILYLRFDLAKQRLTKHTSREDGLIAPNHDKNLVRDWRNRSQIPAVFDAQLNETPRVIGEIYRSAAALSDNKTVLLGSSDFIRVINYRDGGPIVGCRLPIEFEAYRANITPDGRIAVIGHSDGTLRWYRVERADSTCKLHELLAVHISRNSAREWTWSAWLPSGKFANDARAGDLFGWQIENQQGKIDFLPRQKKLELYDLGAITNALDLNNDIPSPTNLTNDLKALITDLGGAESRVTVALPDEFKKISSTKTTFTLFIDDGPTKPQNLTVKTGTGVNISVKRGETTYAPGDPIPIDSVGEFSIELTLPNSLRARNGVAHICFYLDDNLQTCHPIRWTGQKPPPAKRRLWAIFVGISKYKDSDLNLKNAHNDALDLAQVFIQDYQSRVLSQGASVKPDFESINIDLLVSPTTNATSAQQQLNSLQALPYVNVNKPTRKEILKAIQNIVDHDKNEELSRDLVVIYFSGHGYIHPYNKTTGRSLFVTYETDPELPRDTLADTSITSADLLQRLKDISAEKIVIIDACRVPADETAIPMNPGLVNAEFANQVLSAHYFFSSQAGQYSLDQNDFVFNETRPESERGNGLFTYGLLKSLTDPSADLASGKLENRNRIEITEVKRFLDGVFDLGEPTSIASRISKKKKLIDIQQPVYIPARGPGANQPFDYISILRSLETD